jgi:hypothetical protein
MTKRKRNSRYSTPGNSAREKQIQYMSLDLADPQIMESSEISPDTARESGVPYEQFCDGASLIPTPLGWGLLHCTVRDKRGRRKRATLATYDLTYHRAFVAAASRVEGGDPIELAVARYPFMRDGWPGPPRQRGSWPGGGPIPWRPAFRDACPEFIYSHHVHGVQVTEAGKRREICALFSKGRSGAKWTMLDDEVIQTKSMIAIPEPELVFYAPSGVAVMPGWPISSDPEPCPLPVCSES